MRSTTRATPAGRSRRAWTPPLSEQGDLDASVVIAPEKRDRLEHLCKYRLRPPLAEKRLRVLDTGEVALQLKTPYADGTDWITMTPSAPVPR